MVMIRVVGFLLIASIGYVSCQKTTDTLPIDPIAEDSTCRIVQMRQGALDIYDSIFNYEFDDHDRLVRIKRESPDDSSEYSYYFEYDALGRVRQILERVPAVGPLPGTNDVVTKAVYEYNGSFLAKIKIEYYYFSMVKEIMFEYDNSGKLIKKSSEGISRSFPFKDHVTYEYDAKGNISRKRYYDNDTLEGIKEYTYNDDDNIVKAFGLGTESIVYYELDNVLDEDAYLNKNNLTSVVDKWYDGRIFSRSEITYIRDMDDRIIRVDSKRTVGPFKDGVFNYHFFYECK